jgi:nucleoside-triphosphatase THEP1
MQHTSGILTSLKIWPMQIETSKKPLGEVWIKAAVLGASWAAIEIVLGSFLHNLRVPFKGNILTALGFIILIAASFRWKDKGLFWRSGLICALMKTMSPSAVIFGPMIAIFMEALFLDLSTRIFGRNIIGFAIGASLAMSWILFQRIFNLILIYGFKIVEIYTELTAFIERQFNWQFNLALLPLIILLLLYIAFGVFTVVIAMIAGRRIANMPAVSIQQKEQVSVESKKDLMFTHSIPWLVFNFFAMIGAMVAIGYSPLWFWFPSTILLVLAWTQRYKRAMRQMMRPKFWFTFGIITLASSFLITFINANELSWLDGIVTGIQINFRAAVVISGFTVLGTELYHPRIREELLQSRFSNVHTALTLAFETLPAVIAQLPSVKNLFKSPLIYLKLMIEHAEQRAKEIQNRQNQKIIVVSGPRESGKTTRLLELFKDLNSASVNAGGFVSIRILNDKNTSGYNLYDLQKGDLGFLMHENIDFGNGKVGRFFINEEAFETGNKLVDKLIDQSLDVVILDEIGKLEAAGQGWAASLQKALTSKASVVMVSINPEHLDNVSKTFKFNPFQIVNPAEWDAKALTALIVKLIAQTKAVRIV